MMELVAVALIWFLEADITGTWQSFAIGFFVLHGAGVLTLAYRFGQSQQQQERLVDDCKEVAGKVESLEKSRVTDRHDMRNSFSGVMAEVESRHAKEIDRLRAEIRIKRV